MNPLDKDILFSANVYAMAKVPEYSECASQSFNIRINMLASL